MSKAYEIFDEAFSKPRDPRSDEYRQGVIDILKFRLREENNTYRPDRYVIGTSAADAYYAGCNEGHRLATEYLAQQAEEERCAEIVSERARGAQGDAP